jgi:hypothetical protein
MRHKDINHKYVNTVELKAKPESHLTINNKGTTTIAKRGQKKQSATMCSTSER